MEIIVTPIMGVSEATLHQLKQLLESRNNEAPDLTSYYFNCEDIYGVRADVAFCQMLLETNFLTFKRQDGSPADVLPEQHNPAGLGAVGGGAHGETFDNWEQGVEAQFQHLFAYACSEPLPSDRSLVDKRFKYVTRGYAPNVEWLGAIDNPQNENLDVKKGWAIPGEGYGEEILTLIQEAMLFEPQPQPQPEPLPEPKPEPEKRSLIQSILDFILNFIKEVFKGGKK